MKKTARKERPTLDLMEEAVHLLRSTSLQDFSWYLLGVLPFLLALLYFWMDMSWNAVAFQHRTEASFGVALLFLWMKCCQSLFAGKLRARLAGDPAASITWRRLFRVAVFQTLIQPSKFFILPAAALATIPFGWVTAFYENVTALGEGEGTRKLVARSWRLAGFWPRQNHCALSIYLLLLLLVFFNVGILVILLPQLLKMLTGVETVFTRGGASMFNSTFFAIVAALTYLVCNPLLKATYALRCFYGESQRSGADLSASLRALPRLRPLVACVIACTLFFAPGVRAEPAPASAPLSTPAAQLNRAIDDTVVRPEFSWKLPRQAATEGTERKWPFVDAIGRFVKATGKFISNFFKTIFDWLGKRWTPANSPTSSPGSSGWAVSSRGLMIGLLIVLAFVALALIAQTVMQIRRRKLSLPANTAPASKIDLESEHVTADLLPEEEWLALARAHLSQGEVRLALRAFFLASLAHLAARDILLLARHKSNRDYQAELRRKASDHPPLLEAFAQNIATVERVWYGRHEVSPDGLQRFEANLEQIRAC